MIEIRATRGSGRFMARVDSPTGLPPGSRQPADPNEKSPRCSA